MKVKQETKIAFATLSGIYVVFNIIKFAVFSEQSWKWHFATSAGGVLLLGAIGFIVRGIDIYLDKKFPFERNPFSRLTLQFIVTLLAIMGVRLFTIPFYYRVMETPPSKELIVASFAVNVFMVLSLVLSIFGFHFFKKWRQEKISAAELEKEKAIVQYDNLKNQLNPHFLFNALSSLNSLIFENPTLAADFVQQLSKVYRYVLANKDKNAVSLQTEINFLGHYVKLLETRFEEALKIEFHVQEADKEKNIVPVTLQILVENAVKHNITSKDLPLRIEITSKDEFLWVTNNLQRKSVIEYSNQQGLDNLKNLYSYISERPIEVEETESYYRVKIPLL